MIALTVELSRVGAVRPATVTSDLVLLNCAVDEGAMIVYCDCSSMNR